MRRSFLVTVAVALAAYGQKIESQKVDRTRITRVETALNHLTVIEVGEAVKQVATGSASYKVEWRDNKVFVQPLEPDAETNLFIWTESGTRLSYELVPARAVESMHFAIDQEPAVKSAATSPQPAPAPAAEKPLIPSEMLYKSVPVQLAGKTDGKAKVAVQMRDLYEKDGKLYLRYAVRNESAAPYQPGQPKVVSLNSPKGATSLYGLRHTQLADNLANRISAKSLASVKVVHSEVATAVSPGREAVGFLAIELEPADAPQVLHVKFAPNGKQDVVATLVR